MERLRENPGAVGIVVGIGAGIALGIATANPIIGIAVGLGTALLFLRLLRPPVDSERSGRYRSASFQVGLFMGLFFIVVGIATDNFGIIGLGGVMLLIGFTFRS
jgi:hypothetical protein